MELSGVVSSNEIDHVLKYRQWWGAAQSSGVCGSIRVRILSSVVGVFLLPCCVLEYSSIPVVGIHALWPHRVHIPSSQIFLSILLPQVADHFFSLAPCVLPPFLR